MRFALALVLSLAVPALADVPNVATDIAPVHSIVARIMQGVGAPDLIVPPRASPHGYAMRPSEARKLANADLVVWVGPSLTPWLQGPIDTLASGAQHLPLLDAPGTTLLRFRDGVAFEPHEHEHDHGHEDAGDKDHPDTAATDPHAWLDPGNGVIWAGQIAEELSRLDPENARTYGDNLGGFKVEMTALAATIRERLAPVQEARFIVYHDAYHYFEARFGIEAASAISLSDAQTPGAARVSALRAGMQTLKPVCAFVEPQFDARLLDTVTEGQGVRIGVLDPIGADLPTGPGQYPAMLLAIADSMAGCLSQ